MSEQTTDTLQQESISIDMTDPASVGAGISKIIEHLNALHMDIGLLSIAIGILANASETGCLAKPGAVRLILDGLIETYGKRAPLSAMQLQWALGAPIGSPPPDGGKRLTIVRSDEGERKAA